MPQKTNPKVVLVIEDEVDIRNLSSRILQLEGYQVHQSSDGEAGLQLLEGNGGIDLVLLDLTLPGIDGWGVLSRMQGDVRLAEVKVIIFSASAGPLHRERALEMGAVDYLVKPVSAADLIETVGRALKKVKA